jgi:hypothetical protein
MNSIDTITSPVALVGAGGDASKGANNHSIADDILRGARAIGDYIGLPEKKVFYLAEQGHLPIGRIGATLIASKRVLREHYAGLTQGTVDQPLRPEPRTRRASRPLPLRRRRRPATAQPDAG